MFYLILPLNIIKSFVYLGTRGLFAFFASLNTSFLNLFSLPILVKTYFKPWKNEYREGLVGFSIGMGIFIKTFVILADIILFLALMVFEAIFMIAFILYPFAALMIAI
ncbi:MAG: hypothetical protein M1289_00475 [Patescibacteria group bacterium]|nr:hypothetical protein [Patescibacteria group bacterium]